MSTELAKREKKEIKETAPEQLIEATNAFSPDVDILDSRDSLIFVMDLPGVSNGNVKIKVDENNVMTVRARATVNEPEKALLKQFEVGNYFRAFTIGNEYDTGKITAKLENGLLEIFVPKREEFKPVMVEISA